MKRNMLFALLAGCVSVAGHTLAAAAEPSRPPEQANCLADGTEARRAVEELSLCVSVSGDPLYASPMTPDEAADKVLAQCADERRRLEGFAGLCHFAPGEIDTRFRRIALDRAESRHSRADFLWRHNEAWAQGACSNDDPAFEHELKDYLHCVLADVSSAAEQSATRRSANAVARCVAKERPISARLTACQGEKSAELMSGLRAATQQYGITALIHPAIVDATKDASADLRAPELLQLEEDYDACVMFESKARMSPGGDYKAAIGKALEVCGETRSDLGEYVKAHLDADKRIPELLRADDEAAGLAQLEITGEASREP